MERHSNPCWAATVSSCRGKRNREHYFTRGIWHTQYVEIEGVGGPTPKRLSIDNLITKSLCEGHNSDLSPVDQAGIDFINALRRVEELRELRKRLPSVRTVAGCPRLTFRVDGLGIERWALKTMLNCARVLSVPIAEESVHNAARVVFGQGELAGGAGLGMVAAVGDKVFDEERIRVHFGGRPEDYASTAMSLTLRGGWHFMLSWAVPLNAFEGFRVDERACSAPEETIWHPTQLNVAHPINLRVELDWNGRGPNKDVEKLRTRYKAPPR